MKILILLSIFCIAYSANACDIWVKEVSGKLEVMKSGDPLTCPRLLKKEITKLKVDYCKMLEENKAKNSDISIKKLLPAECTKLFKK